MRPACSTRCSKLSSTSRTGHVAGEANRLVPRVLTWALQVYTERCGHGDGEADLFLDVLEGDECPPVTAAHHVGSGRLASEHGLARSADPHDADEALIGQSRGECVEFLLTPDDGSDRCGDRVARVRGLVRRARCVDQPGFDCGDGRFSSVVNVERCVDRLRVRPHRFDGQAEFASHNFAAVPHAERAEHVALARRQLVNALCVHSWPDHGSVLVQPTIVTPPDPPFWGMYFVVVVGECEPMTRRAQQRTARHLARHFVEALFDPVEPIDDVVASEVVLHAWPWAGPGLAGLCEAREALARTWDSQVVDVHETLDAGDHAVLRVTERGVHAGPWQGVEPTGRAVAARAIHIVRVIEDRVVEHWREGDDLGRLRQLGARGLMTADPQHPRGE